MTDIQASIGSSQMNRAEEIHQKRSAIADKYDDCLLYTSDAADERSSVDLGGRRIIKKKTRHNNNHSAIDTQTNNT